MAENVQEGAPTVEPEKDGKRALKSGEVLGDEERDEDIIEARHLVDFPRLARVRTQSRMKSNRFKLFNWRKHAVVTKTCIRFIQQPLRPSLSETAVHPYIGTYVVVGIMHRTSGFTLECMEELRTESGEPRDILDAIRSAIKRLRPWYLRIFTFKSVAAFDIYECNPELGQHSPVQTSDTTDAALLDLYYDFNAGRRDHDDEWKKWIHRNFNRGDSFPGSRSLALRLVLRWSAKKILLFTFVPILLSLAIGFWFIFDRGQADEDYATVVQTAWTVASYIVTTAGVITAVLAAVTSLGDS